MVQESTYGIAYGSCIIHTPHAEFLLSLPTPLRLAGSEGRNASIKSLKDGSIEWETETTSWPSTVPQATDSVSEGGLDLLVERIIPG